MDKRLCICVLFATCIAVLCSYSQAFAEVTGFRGLKWGDKTSDIPGLVLYDFDSDTNWLFDRFFRRGAYPKNSIRKRNNNNKRDFNIDDIEQNIYADIFAGMLAGEEYGFDEDLAKQIFKYGVIKGDKRQIGEVQTSLIYYFFIDDKLSGVYFQVSGKGRSSSQLSRDWDVLASAFKQYYGERCAEGDICIRISESTAKDGYGFLNVTFYGYENEKVRQFLFDIIDQRDKQIAKKRKDEIDKAGKSALQDLGEASATTGDQSSTEEFPPLKYDVNDTDKIDELYIAVGEAYFNGTLNGGEWSNAKQPVSGEDKFERKYVIQTYHSKGAVLQIHSSSGDGGRSSSLFRYKSKDFRGVVKGLETGASRLDVMRYFGERPCGEENGVMTYSNGAGATINISIINDKVEEIEINAVDDEYPDEIDEEYEYKQ